MLYRNLCFIIILMNRTGAETVRIIEVPEPAVTLALHYTGVRVPPHRRRALYPAVAPRSRRHIIIILTL